jgi:hypothetical protein
MIGVPYNPDNCAFISNQALNSNQFNPNVPQASNSSNHTILWDFIEKKLYWVNTLTNIIEKEFPSGNAGGNELLSNYTGFNSTYLANITPTVYGNNYIILYDVTYNFELEWDIREGTPVTFGEVFAEIRTNTDQSITTASVSDVVQSQRVTTTIPEIFKVGSPGALLNQNVCRNNITFANPFIVKSVFYCFDSVDNPTKDIGRLFLRALKVK